MSFARLDYRLFLPVNTRPSQTLSFCRPLGTVAGQDNRRDRSISRPSRSTGLVAGPDARAIVAMEVFVEQDVVPPMRIGLKFLGAAVNRPPADSSRRKDACQPVRNFLGHLEEVHQFARAGRALDLEVVAVVEIELQQARE